MRINYIYDQPNEAKKSITEWAKAFNFQRRVEATVWGNDKYILLKYEGLSFMFDSIGKYTDDNKCVTEGVSFPCIMTHRAVEFNIPTIEALQTIIKAITNEL